MEGYIFTSLLSKTDYQNDNRNTNVDEILLWFPISVHLRHMGTERIFVLKVCLGKHLMIIINRLVSRVSKTIANWCSKRSSKRTQGLKDQGSQIKSSRLCALWSHDCTEHFCSWMSSHNSHNCSWRDQGSEYSQCGSWHYNCLCFAFHTGCT